MAAAPANAAFIFVGANYQTQGPTVVGRQVASEEFLRGFVRHAGVGRYLCYTHTEADYREFVGRIQAWAGEGAETSWLQPIELGSVSEVGTMFRPGPDIGHYAWLRRHIEQRGFSLCGVTHATADDLAMDALAGLFTAPLQAWDALVCPSQAVKRMIERFFEGWAEYLAERFAGAAERAFELPVIPLGVDCDRFADRKAAAEARAALRARHGIGDDDVAVLYMGRLSHIDKANPLPLYRALEAAAGRATTKLHLLQAGWFANAYTENAFRTAAQALAPHVNVAFVDGRLPEMRQGIWSAADIFASFPDSLQETFGLAPLEAMAAALPVVVSDWNGYRESVRDGVDGYAVPTTMPGRGVGTDLAYFFAADVVNYQGYALATSQSIAVDAEAAADAFVRLAMDAGLRRRMGEAGRARAAERYDWRVVVGAYQALWEELGARRQSAPERWPRRAGAAAHPLRHDPYALFEAYASRTILPSSLIGAVAGAEAAEIGTFLKLAVAAPLPALLLRAEVMVGVVDDLAAGGPRPMAEIVADFPAGEVPALYRSIGWLAKIGLVRVLEAPRS